MDKTVDVTALGELLVDFTSNGESAQGNPLFEANPGGAPCNVLAMLGKLGRRTAFIGKVGEDFLGEMLARKAGAQGIDLTGLVRDKEIPTTLAFVMKKPDGDRDFSFYRKPGADVMLTAGEVEAHAALIRGARIFHFGTLSMTSATCFAATELAVTIAKEAGCLLSFDPNYRAPLWTSEEAAKEKIRYGLANCDILKISDNEIELMTGETDMDRGMRKLLKENENHILLAFATLGPDGSRAYLTGADITASCPGFRNLATIETTGAGDTFCACALHFVLEYAGDAPGQQLCPDRVSGALDEAKLVELLTFANAAASLITTRKGALAVMPEKEEVEAYKSQQDQTLAVWSQAEV